MSRPLLATALVLGACQPDITSTAPTTFVTAVFDPTTASIPLPNDLVFLNPSNSVCPAPANTLPAGSPPACAQAELLDAFNGAFPSDQAISVTIDFTETSFDSSGVATNTAPDLDLTTFTPTTYFVYGRNGDGTGEIAMDPIQPTDYVKSADHGELTLHHANNQPWAPGTYAVLVRGGDNGVKTTDGLPVNPSEIFYLLTQGKDLIDPANNGLLRDELGSEAAAQAEGMQLNAVISMYNQVAFPAADTRFPHQELAVLTSFSTGPLVTNVTIDPARSLVPLPIDLLRDPTSGKLSALAACTFAGSSLAADGTCPSSAAAGFEALDGFSTTGAILAPTSDLIDATTVDATSLMLFDLTDPANPVQVDPNSLVLEPCEFTSACGSPALSPVIAIQPAGATAGDATSVFRTKPLKDNTDYAVVITTGVLDKAGNPIGPGTVAKILHFTNPVLVGGHSALSGIDDGTAASLEKMRLQLAPVFAALAAGGTDFSKIGIAYTFHTQTILSQAHDLAELPYDPALSPALSGAPLTAISALTPSGTPTSAFTKYGVDSAIVPSSDIQQVVEFDIDTLDALDPLTGAFMPDPTSAPQEVIHVLLALPKPGTVPACTGAAAGLGTLGLKCAPLMVFRHGLGGGRADMLTVANEYAKAGMVTVAIDAAKHGDRSFCTPSGPAAQCVSPAVCTTNLPGGAQGDASPPGTCTNGKFQYLPVSPTCSAPGSCGGYAYAEGIPAVSGNYLVSANFFRTRDSMRQDLIDESQLIRAVAFAPPAGYTGGHNLFDFTSTTLGYVVDPTTIYYSGQSLGAIQGAMDVASNPRITKAGFNVGGGSIVDIFTNSPAFVNQTDALLAGLGIEPGTSAYLQFLVVAKTVIDPADPVNFVGHLTANTLKDWTNDDQTNQAPKTILTQMANCDQTVPNPFNLIYASNVPTGPEPTGAAFFTPGATGTFQLFVGPGFDPVSTPFGTCSATTAVEHAFITDWVTAALTTKAQDDIANFVRFDTLPLSVEQ